MAYSLIIVSRNRPAFLLRLLRYYRDCSLRAPIFLGDSSAGEACAQVRAAVEGFRETLDINFSAYPEDVPVLDKLRTEYSKVATTYVAWVGDDDFLLPVALEAGTQVLDRQPDCAAIIGRAAVFSVADDAATGKIQTLGDYAQRAVGQHRAGDRLLAQARQGSAFTYSLRRTALAQKILAALNSRLWPDDVFGYYFFEVLDGFITAVSGKVIAVDQLKMVRQVHLNSSAAAGWARTNAFRMTADERWPQFISNVSAILSESLLEADPALSKAEAAEITELALWIRVNGAMAAGINRELARRSAAPLAPPTLRRLVRQTLPRVADRTSLLRQRLRQKRSLSSNDYAALNRILRLVEYAP